MIPSTHLSISVKSLLKVNPQISFRVVISKRFKSTGPTPQHRLKYISPDASIPIGFRLAGISSGVKKEGKDLTLITSAHPATAAATFTTNLFSAAPVLVSKSVLNLSHSEDIYHVVINSGCANACTGEKGVDDAWEMVKCTDQLMGSQDREPSTLVMSTGVIGQHLQMGKIKTGIKDAIKNLGNTYHHVKDAAEGIMTTDTFPKFMSRKCRLPSGVEYTLLGICKGAGMIHPNMRVHVPTKHATMLATILTDLSVDVHPLQTALEYSVDRSFNSVSVDGDTSTNDTVAILANGGIHHLEGQESLPKPVIEDSTSRDFVAFRNDLTDFSTSLAQLIPRDGEGATKFVTVQVTGAPTYQLAKQIASSVSTSALVKTAFHGEDANWGRILCAVGYTPAASNLNPQHINLYLSSADDTLHLVSHGRPHEIDEDRASKILKNEDFTIRVELGAGKEKATYWTCDFSEEYVKINGDYRS
ncbi:hypothetical protein BKA69DRAFT_1066137 [Paraphysoderma sedebokerense]|nr:hypothetical protein BKA69DRAFT_1105737 [Paraphysoderma sedebokerense]KAI9142735.1 hypothetical protein BKA69DRAFT_1066137 [Paraphysoderma sedebokerense]